MSTDPRHGEASDRPDDVDPGAAGEASETDPADPAASAGPLPDAPGAADASGPDAPSPVAASPVASSPATPSPVAPSPVAPSPVAPSPATPSQVAPEAAPSADSPTHTEPPVSTADQDATVATPVPAATDEEDAALRAERARRFGRFGRSREEADQPAAQEVRTTALPAPAEPAPATAALPVEQPPLATATPEPEIDEGDPFEDWDEPPRSRAQSHWWVVLITLVFTPPAWYLITDGGERWSTAREVTPEAIHFGALVEIAGGLVLLAAVLIGTRWSSVGPIIVGSIATLIGGAFLAIPQMVEDFLAEYIEVFTRLGQFGQNVYAHLLMDGNAGRILAYGVVLIFAGVISHGARRQGRREERRRAAVEAL